MLQVKRHDLKKIPRKPGVEVHVSHLVLIPGDDETRRDYLEIREYNTAAEIYGHGILIPRNMWPVIREAGEQAMDDR